MASSVTSDLVMTAAVNDVINERQRQKTVEGWTPEHDDEHVSNELARAGLSYVGYMVSRAWKFYHDSDGYRNAPAPDSWPWDERWWKPKDPRRDLVRAAALIIAEIERRDRQDERERIT